MKYCAQCGSELSEGASFCSACGAPTGNRSAAAAGKTVKCPQCGELIDAFVAKCPACGYELRGSQTLSRVRELEDALRDIDSVKKRSELIRNFYIPNTKEDIYEFVILATSNIKSQSADSDAWLAKLEQAYQKASLVFGEGGEFKRIEKKYIEACRDSKRSKKNGLISRLGKTFLRSKQFQKIAAAIFLVLIGLLVVLYSSWSEDYLLMMIGMYPIMGSFALLLNLGDDGSGKK